jgi:menaquinone-specific isochorismate synthase
MTTSGRRPLVATVEEIDPGDAPTGAGWDFLFEQPGELLASWGAAAVVRLPHGLADPRAAALVTETLGAIDVRGEVPGMGDVGPVAVGALPFDRDAPTAVVIPSLALRRAGGRTWLTWVSADGVRPALPPTPPSPPAPDAFTLTPSMPHSAWCSLVDKALAEIDAGHLEKVVLAREVRVEANRPIPRGAVIERLRALYPSCTIFAAGGFVGASPELLVRRDGETVASFPLAGTVARSGDAAADDRLAATLLASPKDRAEHAMVVDAIAAVLGPLAEELVVPPTPSLLRLRNVTHLATPVTGRLRAPAPSALALAQALHPTPAVSGLPVADACRWLAAFEQLERGRFAGPVGWVDRNGDGCYVVGIRSAELDGHRARLFAGVGIVAGSDPDEELAETQLKLQALLAAVVRP